MRSFKKLAAAVLAAAIGAVLCIIPASAKELANNLYYNESVNNTFSVNCTSDGTMSISFTTSGGGKSIKITVFDANGREVDSTTAGATQGKYDNTAKKFLDDGGVNPDVAGKLTYKVSAGTYKIETSGSTNNGKFSICVAYPSGAAKKKTDSGNSSDKPKSKPDTTGVSMLSGISDSKVVICLEPKSTVKLGASFKGEIKDAKWTSSDSKVAKVDSNGKVKAVKEGTAVITAEKDGSKVSVTVIVEK